MFFPVQSMPALAKRANFDFGLLDAGGLATDPQASRYRAIGVIDTTA